MYLNKINPTVGSTLIVYQHTTIIDTFIDLKPTATNFNMILRLLDNSRSPYEMLGESRHR
ncbi:hypothetical protein GCM10028773_63670 [Spirosoma koreense]